MTRQTKYYKMVGYYAAGKVYEQFVLTGNPSISSITNPKTGHPLIHCFVSTYWEQ
jgi:hypothetical protein